MGNRCSGFGDALPFAFGQMDGMAHDRTGTGQAEVFVDVQIVSGPGEQFCNPRDFFALFAQVGLHQAIGMLGPKRTCGLKLFWRGGGRKARRDDIAKPILRVPALQHGLAVIIAGLSGITKRVWRIAVHHHLACKQPQPPRLRLSKKCGATAGVGCGVTAGGGDAVGEVQVQIPRGNQGCVIRIAQPDLFGESIAVEPVDQPLAP